MKKGKGIRKQDENKAADNHNAAVMHQWHSHMLKIVHCSNQSTYNRNNRTAKCTK